MSPSTKLACANGLMTLGLLPYLVVFGYAVWAHDARGDDALGAIFMILLGLGVAYMVALAIALPGYWWSSALRQGPGGDTRLAKVLRVAVLAGVFPVLAIFPALAYSVLL